MMRNIARDRYCKAATAHTHAHRCIVLMVSSARYVSCGRTNQTGTEDPFLLIAGLRGRACYYYYYFTRFVFCRKWSGRGKKKLIRSPGRRKSTACYASAAPGVIYYYPLRRGEEGHQQTDRRRMDVQCIVVRGAPRLVTVAAWCLLSPLTRNAARPRLREKGQATHERVHVPRRDHVSRRPRRGAACAGPSASDGACDGGRGQGTVSARRATRASPWPTGR